MDTPLFTTQLLVGYILVSENLHDTIKMVWQLHQKSIMEVLNCMKNEIKITFVKSPEEGEICAVFVNEFWDRSKTKLTSYMHIGQHAGCSPDILKNWPLATEQEYRSLLEELNTIGYENIKIIQSRIH